MKTQGKSYGQPVVAKTPFSQAASARRGGRPGERGAPHGGPGRAASGPLRGASPRGPVLPGSERGGGCRKAESFPSRGPLASSLPPRSPLPSETHPTLDGTVLTCLQFSRRKGPEPEAAGAEPAGFTLTSPALRGRGSYRHRPALSKTTGGRERLPQATRPTAVEQDEPQGPGLCSPPHCIRGLSPGGDEFSCSHPPRPSNSEPRGWPQAAASWESPAGECSL